MLFIETQGSWRQMGVQLGERFSSELRRLVEHFHSLLKLPPDCSAATNPLAQVLRRHCPPLWDETLGIAQGAGLDLSRLMVYRFIGELSASLLTLRHDASVHQACTNVYFPRTDAGPLLGRNNDIEDDFTQQLQLCRVSRPSDGCATITTTYLGMAVAIGMNAHGLGVGTSSAHTTVNHAGDGWPGCVMLFDLMQQCQDVEQAGQLLAMHNYGGKSMNMLVGDAQGRSRLFECVPGLPPQPYDPPQRPWNACTNTFMSGRFPPPPESRYQESSWARWGLIACRCEAGQTPFTVSGMQQLLTDAAMPGPVNNGMDGRWKTAYSTVLALRQRKMWISFGHPGQQPYREVSL
jgi:predicted choloylglycine hydrolase